MEPHPRTVSEGGSSQICFSSLWNTHRLNRPAPDLQGLVIMGHLLLIPLELRRTPRSRLNGPAPDLEGFVQNCQTKKLPDLFPNKRKFCTPMVPVSAWAFSMKWPCGSSHWSERKHNPHDNSIFSQHHYSKRKCWYSRNKPVFRIV